MFVSQSHLKNDFSPWTRDLWWKGVLLKLGFRKTGFFRSSAMIFCVFQIIRVFGSLRTTLMCIVGELPRGRSVAVAVYVSDSLQVTGDT